MKSIKNKYSHSSFGFSLVEVMISIFVITVAIIPLLGLIPLGVKNVQISLEETHGVHLLNAVVQDLKYSRTSELKSNVFKLSQMPFSGASEGVVNRVWIDSCWNVYEAERPSNKFCYELEWTYTKVPDLKSFLPVEGSFIVRWPPALHRDASQASNKGGEVSAWIAFRKPQP